MDGTYRLLDRTYYGDSGRLEVADVAGNDGQAVFQRRGGDEQVCPVVPNGSGQLSPSSCGGGIYGKNAVAVPGQHPVEPESRVPGEGWVASLLLPDASQCPPR